MNRFVLCVSVFLFSVSQCQAQAQVKWYEALKQSTDEARKDLEQALQNKEKAKYDFEKLESDISAAENVIKSNLAALPNARAHAKQALKEKDDADASVTIAVTHEAQAKATVKKMDSADNWNAVFQAHSKLKEAEEKAKQAKKKSDDAQAAVVSLENDENTAQASLKKSQALLPTAKATVDSKKQELLYTQKLYDRAVALQEMGQKLTELEKKKSVSPDDFQSLQKNVSRLQIEVLGESNVSSLNKNITELQKRMVDLQTQVNAKLDVNVANMSFNALKNRIDQLEKNQKDLVSKDDAKAIAIQAIEDQLKKTDSPLAKAVSGLQGQGAELKRIGEELKSLKTEASQKQYFYFPQGAPHTFHHTDGYRYVLDGPVHNYLGYYWYTRVKK